MISMLLPDGIRQPQYGRLVGIVIHSLLFHCIDMHAFTRLRLSLIVMVLALLRDLHSTTVDSIVVVRGKRNQTPRRCSNNNRGGASVRLVAWKPMGE